MRNVKSEGASERRRGTPYLPPTQVLTPSFNFPYPGMQAAFVPTFSAGTTMSTKNCSAGSGSSSGTRYTHGHAEPVLRSHTWRTAKNSAAYLLPHLRRDAAVLDLGCGPGTITADLADLVPDGSVVGVDIAPTIISAATNNHAVARTNLTFTTADVTSGLPYPDGTFDVVHAHQLLQHLPSPAAALREMGRVCRRGGVVAARDADYGAMTWAPAAPALDAWRARYRALARANGGDPDAGRSVLRYARAAGFTRVCASASTWCFADDVSRAWWGGLWAERVSRPESELARQLHEAGVPVEEVEAMRTAWAEWAADPTGWFAVIHGEVVCFK
jgi:SAM-dependent methyltransferase